MEKKNLEKRKINQDYAPKSIILSLPIHSINPDGSYGDINCILPHNIKPIPNPKNYKI